MIRRTYRVIARGRFPDLTTEQRARLLAEADRHTVFEAEFTEAGTLTYERSLTGWVGRVQVVAEEERIDDADALAELLGRERIEAILDGFDLAPEDPHLAVTCLDDVKINRRAGRR